MAAQPDNHEAAHTAYGLERLLMCIEMPHNRRPGARWPPLYVGWEIADTHHDEGRQRPTNEGNVVVDGERAE